MNIVESVSHSHIPLRVLVRRLLQLGALLHVREVLVLDDGGGQQGLHLPLAGLHDGRDKIFSYVG